MALDKLKFWKKKDDFDFPDMGTGKDFGGDFGPAGNEFGADPSGRGVPGGSAGYGGGMDLPGTYSAPSQHGSIGLETQRLIQKDMELISAKIDSLRSEMEQINQRLANIEANLGVQRQRGYSKYGYP